MAKKFVDPLALVNNSTTELEKTGLQQSFGNMVLDTRSAPDLAKAKTIAVAITLPQDKSKRTVDIIFDEKKPEILLDGKKPRELSKGNVTLKVFAKTGTGQLPKGAARTFIFDKVFKSAIKKIAQEIDEAIKDKEMLQRFDQNLKLSRLTQQEKTAMVGKRVLLLVHGIFSKTEAAFGDLTKSFKDLEKIYGDRIIAYDHFTLSKTAKQNAADLLAQLPENTAIDIICHSRGAGVVRFLVEQPSNRNQLKQKGITIGTVCFVAGACEGSPLATKSASTGYLSTFANKVDLLGFDATGAAQGELWHINFFDQLAVRQKLLGVLR